MQLTIPEHIYKQIFKYNKIFDSDKEFESDKKIILLLGSSNVGQLNVAKINEIVSSQHTNYEIFNLAYNADTPKVRFNSIEETISLKPKYVFYGVSFIDFRSPTEKENIFDSYY